MPYWTPLMNVIHTEQENDHYLAALEALHEGGHVTPEEERLSELLTLLIEDFENRHYQLKPAAPNEIIRELMDANALKESDLVEVFGNKSVLSEILNGERDLSKANIQKLSDRFHVSPEVFFY
jgi:HTH-type transcriptional regulator/antitoxin HigA